MYMICIFSRCPREWGQERNSPKTMEFWRGRMDSLCVEHPGIARAQIGGGVVEGLSVTHFRAEMGFGLGDLPSIVNLG